MNAEELNIELPNDYTVRLCVYLEQMLGKPFVWGETHCTAIVFGAIDAMYGTDYYKWHKETHNVTDKEKAIELCADKETLKVFNDIGFMEIDFFSIKAGDVLYINKDEYECCYVYSGSSFISASIDGQVECTNYSSIKHLLTNNNYKVFTICHK
tara:strand:- start:6427 stop:6888 length:462 start_codon:yes stop_codon:yes gene_type:complete